ncbi:hypothetical protein L209DRAFT_218929 [Thermothelomyces heterothallicus CBS 203.75]
MHLPQPRHTRATACHCHSFARSCRAPGSFFPPPNQLLSAHHPHVPPRPVIIRMGKPREREREKRERESLGGLCNLATSSCSSVSIAGRMALLATAALCYHGTRHCLLKDLQCHRRQPHPPPRSTPCLGGEGRGGEGTPRFAV